jgi:hypothetical protein
MAAFSLTTKRDRGNVTKLAIIKDRFTQRGSETIITVTPNWLRSNGHFTRGSWYTFFRDLATEGFIVFDPFNESPTRWRLVQLKPLPSKWSSQNCRDQWRKFNSKPETVQTVESTEPQELMFSCCPNDPMLRLSEAVAFARDRGYLVEALVTPPLKPIAL